MSEVQIINSCRLRQILNKRTFPVLSQAIRQSVLDVEMSFDLGNPVKTFTNFWSSILHIRIDPSQDDDACSGTINKNVQSTPCNKTPYSKYKTKALAKEKMYRDNIKGKMKHDDQLKTAPRHRTWTLHMKN